MLELKEQMACKEAEASATIKELSERFETIDVVINEERNKRRVLSLQLSFLIFFPRAQLIWVTVQIWENVLS